MKQIKILVTARYKVAGSDSQVVTIQAGEIISRDAEYADFLVSQGLAEFYSDVVTYPEMPLESPEIDDGRKVVEIPTDTDSGVSTGIVEPVGASLERDGKIGKGKRRK